MSWLRRFDTRRLAIVITFLAIFAMAARISVDTDTWWHLRAGQWIMDNRSVPRVDPFSYTRLDYPWEYPGWIVQVCMLGIYRVFGPGGLNLWTAGMVTLAFAFIWRTLSGGVFLRAFMIILAASSSAVYWAARPYLITFLLAAIYLWVLEDYRVRGYPLGDKRIWCIPALMVIWANSHGGFAVGFIILGVYILSMVIVEYRTSKLAITVNIVTLRLLITIFAFTILAVCLNPYGPVMLLYPFKTVGIGALQDYIQEWQSPNFHSVSVQPFAWLLLLTLGTVGISRRRLSWTDFALTAGFAYLGLLAGRNVALFALVAPMVVTRHASPILEALGRHFGYRINPKRIIPTKQAYLNLLIVGLMLLGVGYKVSLVFPASANEEVFRESFPVEAVEYIHQTQPPGRLLNSYNWGAYLLWALPEYPVFVDGRTDLYNDEIIGEWLQIVRAEDGWQEALDRWEVHLVMLEPNTPLVYRLEVAGWQQLYSDEVAVLYGR